MARKEAGADDPLRDAKGDLYDLAPVAYHLARVISRLKGEGQVVAVNAAWGGGKTSVVNLTRKLFDPDEPMPGSERELYRPKRCPPETFKADIETWRRSRTRFVDFNAWLDTGNEAIAFSIIDTIADSLVDSSKAVQVGKQVGRHVMRHPGRLVKGLIGTFNVTNLALGHEQQTEAQFDINSLRKLERTVARVIRKIKKTARRLVIVVDDIDRMPPERIQSLIVALWWIRKLPSVCFLLLYDNRQVIDSLARTMFHSSERGDAEQSAARFLEKIVQYSFDVPQPTREKLLSELEAALKDPKDPKGRKEPTDPKEERPLAAIAAEKIPGPAGDLFVRDQRWGAIKNYILRDLVNTPRAVKRLVLATENSWAMRAYVPFDLRDLIALEAVRLFRPALFVDIEKLAARIERGDNVMIDWHREASASAEQTIQAVLMPAHFRGDKGQPLESSRSVAARRGFGVPWLMTHYLQGVPYPTIAAQYNIEDFFHQRWEPFHETLIQAAKEDRLRELSMAIGHQIFNGWSNDRTHKELAERLRQAADAVEVSEPFSSSLAKLLREEADVNDEYDYEYE